MIWRGLWVFHVSISLFNSTLLRSPKHFTVVIKSCICIVTRQLLDPGKGEFENFLTYLWKLHQYLPLTEPSLKLGWGGREGWMMIRYKYEAWDLCSDEVNPDILTPQWPPRVSTHSTTVLNIFSSIKSLGYIPIYYNEIKRVLKIKLIIKMQSIM